MVTYYHAKFKAPIKVLCETLDVSRSAYYEHLKHKDDKANYNAKIVEAIREIQEENSYRLGVDKIRELLISNYSNILKKKSIARNKVYKLMRENNLTCKTRYNKLI